MRAPQHRSRPPARADAHPADHPEHSAVAVVTEPVLWHRKALHGRSRVRAQRHQRVDRDPLDVAVAPDPVDQRAEPRQLGRGKEHVHVRVDQADQLVAGDLGDDPGQHVDQVAAHRRDRVGAGHGSGGGEPGDGAGLRRDAGGEPARGRRVGQVQRLAVHPDSRTDPGQMIAHGRTARPHLAAQRHRRAGVAGDEAVAVGQAVRVAVPVEVQPQPGARAQVDQRQRARVVRGHQRQRRQHVQAPPDLVHLVAVLPAQPAQRLLLGPGEGAQRGTETVVARGLRTTGVRVVRRQVPWLDLGHPAGDRRAEQQRRQPLGRQLGGEVEEHVLLGDRVERLGGQPPARRGVGR